jgi:DNA-binding transcriptional MerR regulator
LIREYAGTIENVSKFTVASDSVHCHSVRMRQTFSAVELAESVNRWCAEHRIAPVSGQAGERVTERNIRYYRTLGLVDAPESGGGQGYGEKHRLQVLAIRLLQAQGLPLTRIQRLLYGRSLEDLRRIEKQGLAELPACAEAFRPMADESWRVTPLDDEYLLISRRGRVVPEAVRARLLAALDNEGEQQGGQRAAGRRTK